MPRLEACGVQMMPKFLLGIYFQRGTFKIAPQIGFRINWRDRRGIAPKMLKNFRVPIIVSPIFYHPSGVCCARSLRVFGQTITVFLVIIFVTKMDLRSSQRCPNFSQVQAGYEKPVRVAAIRVVTTHSQMAARISNRSNKFK